MRQKGIALLRSIGGPVWQLLEVHICQVEGACGICLLPTACRLLHVAHTHCMWHYLMGGGTHVCEPALGNWPLGVARLSGAHICMVLSGTGPDGIDVRVSTHLLMALYQTS